MTEKTIIVSNRAGIHARPSSMIVQLLKNYKCSVYFEKDKDRINAKSIMGLLTLGAGYGTEIKIIADGEGEEDAVRILTNLFDSKFEGEI